MVHVTFDMFVDRPGVVRKLDRWRHRTLSRTGAYGMGTMKKILNRPQRTGVKATTVTILSSPPWANGAQVPLVCRVQRRADGSSAGPVLDVATGNPVSQEDARKAWFALAKLDRQRNAGRPPRRGPTGLLRGHTYFGVEMPEGYVAVGPEPFAKQPPMRGAISVPELLNEGGMEELSDGAGGRVWVQYDPHPFTIPTFEPTLRFMQDLIERQPVAA